MKVIAKGFVPITVSDFIVRSSYQMGKSPLLPIYAATLGAGDVFLGFIVSVSTMTGMILKPIFGVLSDRFGRKLWLFIGIMFFVGTPFLYRFIYMPEHLFAVRMIHGIATAIYGPVTVAYVAEISRERRAERLGCFSIARNAGYVVGPLAASWMLVTMNPEDIFTIIGILSALVFIPFAFLPGVYPMQSSLSCFTLCRTISSALSQTFVNIGRSPKFVKKRLVSGDLNSAWMSLFTGMATINRGMKTPIIWLSGGLDAVIYTAVYGVKTFLPLMVLSSGGNILLAGAFLSIQEGVHLVCNPLGGKLGDRLGFMNMILVGMVVLGIGLWSIPLSMTSLVMLLPALLLGVGQSLVLPSTVALASLKVDENALGVSIGFLGSLKNVGKIAGPVLAGLIVHWLGYTYTFIMMGSLILFVSLLLWMALQEDPIARRHRQPIQIN